MNIRILCIITAILFVTTISLSICLIIPNPECERIHLDWDKPYSFIPDEETAIKIADIFVKIRCEIEEREFDKDYYNVKVTLDEEKNEWFVHYKPPSGYLGGGIEIYLQRDNGMVADFVFGR